MKYQKIKPLLPILDSYTTKEKIFAARGIAPLDVYHYLNTSDEDILDPTLLNYMYDGAVMLAKHIKNGDQIYVIADTDVDGFTSAACLLNYLNRVFPYAIQNNFHYGMHTGKQHGLADQMDIIKNSNYKLVICPDSASNDVECHKELKELGIDILILDHHMVTEEVTDACLINNQSSPEYTNKELSGVGVVYKFCQYLDSLMGVSYADYFLDLVAVGNIADMMCVKSLETKRLIEKGLAAIHNPYLKEAVLASDFTISRYGGLCPHTVGFYIAPPINATIRFGAQEDKILVFEAMLDYKGDELIPSTKRGCKGQLETRATQAVRTATGLKKKQDTAVEQTMNTIKEIIEEKKLYENKVIAVKIKPGLIANKNITGLIANKLMKEYKHPVLLLNETEHDGETCWEGSARSVETPEFDDFRGFMEESGYALLAAGHNSAFGSGIADKDFEEFISYSNEALADCDFSPCASVDFIWDAKSVYYRDIEDIAEMNLIYGQGFEQPKVAIENVVLTRNNTSLRGDKCPTLTIALNDNIKAIKFWAKDIYKELEPSETGSVTVNLIGTCSLNSYNGIITGQIEIEGYEIVNRLEYYF